ncbi:hypothetical protein BVRB_4g090590 isoform A [Beta vulgaris subsp. vulgaris]|uniref:uncharacterized protein LOC104891876 isoform X2 n=1 Tax=Beta vulgaris subsp. vulgaris TaxID=3555 RepID=UPI00053F9E0C|nr:uncharacterized protein LOC104891876 isoform X2 [Beta vulgaris subsp. vulgaris]KMT12979.1 hypothetical protein BVRB_4g090590 isoform A [Beta vulgaris subsp. vulgaris]
MGQKVEFPVFTETNLGTRIVIAVSPDITAGKFKGEFERAHVDCFPELGLLSINAVMVKQNSQFYHLSDLLPLKHVFQGFQDSWLLHVKASLKNNLADINNSKKFCLVNPLLVKTDYHLGKKKKRKKRRPKVKELPSSFSHERLEREVLHPSSKVPDSNATAESPHGSLSGAVSVSGIINRYFTNLINVDHIGCASTSEVPQRTAKCDVGKVCSSKRSSKKQNSLTTPKRLLPSPLQENSISVALTNKYERSEIGERLVVASNNLGSSLRSTWLKSKKLWDANAESIVRNLVFEIDNNE